MCGDGTNDVGSLKRSHCGVAIINKAEPNKDDKKKFSGMMSMYLKPQQLVGMTNE
jgi:magnesium-transporting ATPase (P-type)